VKGAVFLDRDGVINIERPDYVKSWQEFTFIEGSVDALSTLRNLELPVFVVTNQSAVNRGLLTREVLEEINGNMKDEIERHGGRIDRIFYCPHRPDEDCDCRKPRTGLFIQAASQFGISLRQSYMIGNSPQDAFAATSVGCLPVMIAPVRVVAPPSKTKALPQRTVFVPNLRSAIDYVRIVELGRSTGASTIVKE